jgi:hypothetical protein
MTGRVGYGSWFSHVRSWRKGLPDDDTLLLRYEDLCQDFRGSVIAAADRASISIRAENWARIEERRSFRFMKQHETKFDHAYEVLWERGWRPGRFLRNGKPGTAGTELVPDQVRALSLEGRDLLATLRLASPPTIDAGRRAAGAGDG